MKKEISEQPKIISNRRNRYFAPLGLLVIVLVIIGLITVVVFSVNLTGKILDNTREKEKFSRIIYPVMMFDPVTFENPNQLDPLFLLQSCLWATLLTNDRDKYSYDETGTLIVPVSDVDVAAKKLFGENIQLEHQSFNDMTTSYAYDDDIKAYHVPVVGQTGQYTPRIDKIVKKKDTYTLTVAYIPPGDLWSMDTKGTVYEPEPAKYMTYVLKKVKGDYNIVAIRMAEGVESSNTSSSSVANSVASSSGSSSDTAQNAA